MKTLGRIVIIIGLIGCALVVIAGVLAGFSENTGAGTIGAAIAVVGFLFAGLKLFHHDQE
jgi:hypothetical protein